MDIKIELSGQNYFKGRVLNIKKIDTHYIIEFTGEYSRPISSQRFDNSNPLLESFELKKASLYLQTIKLNYADDYFVLSCSLDEILVQLSDYTVYNLKILELEYKVLVDTENMATLLDNLISLKSLF